MKSFKYLPLLSFLFLIVPTSSYALPECGEETWSQFSDAVNNYRYHLNVRPLSRAITRIKNLNCEWSLHDNQTPLSYLCSEIELRIGMKALPGSPVSLLLNAGADINAKSSDGTAIIPDIVAENSHYWLDDVDDFINEFKLDYGADLNVRGYSGKTILHKAVTLDYSPVLPDPYVGAIEGLMAAGANIATTDDNGQNPIEYYFTRLDVNAVHSSANAEFLIGKAIDNGLTSHEFTLDNPYFIHGADHKKFKSNLLALMLLYGNDHLITKVFNTGASRKLSIPGISPLIAAIFRESNGFHGADSKFPMVKYLFDLGADVNENDGYGTSVLWYSVFPTKDDYSSSSHQQHNGINIGLTDFLVNKGANVNIKYDGDTLVTYASTCVTEDSLRWGDGGENLKLLQSVLSKGANPNEPNSTGKRPLQLAIETLCGQATVDLLKKYGAQ